MIFPMRTRNIEGEKWIDTLGDIRDLSGEVIFKYHGEYDAIWDLTKIYRQLTDVGTSGFNQWFSAIAEGENVFRSFGNTAVNILKKVLVELATAIAMATILNILFPAARGGKGFGGFLKGLLGFENPENDMFAMKEGRDFFRMFLGGGQQVLGSQARAAGQVGRSEPLVIYSEPGVIVKKMSDMGQVEKTKFYRNVIRTTQRIEGPTT